MGNACYYSVEKLLSSSLLSKNLKVRIYKAVILPVVLYGCETWTLTLREEHRLRVFENKVLRKIFGAKRDEVTGEWRQLHNTELHALYSSPDLIRNIKSRRLRWAGHVARMGESRNACRVLVGRPEGKRPLGMPRRRWEDNIKMDLREVGYDDRDWINLAQDRDRWRAYSHNEPSGSLKAICNKGGYVPVFIFPNEEKLRQAWIRKIPRKHWQPSKWAVVCIYHFHEQDVIKVEKYKDSSGEWKERPIDRLKLVTGALPTIFPDLPAYLSTPETKKRRDPEERRARQTEAHAEKEKGFLEKDIIKDFSTFTDNVSGKSQLLKGARRVLRPSDWRTGESSYSGQPTRFLSSTAASALGQGGSRRRASYFCRPGGGHLRNRHFLKSSLLVPLPHRRSARRKPRSLRRAVRTNFPRPGGSRSGIGSSLEETPSRPRPLGRLPARETLCLRAGVTAQRQGLRANLLSALHSSTIARPF
ncbi:hypothetical protein ANN_00658 [Periplaneta americana]|uniref:THAP-type domain-containing protein n=1 Tax=Periplaneta americana TaxID=6978 RepID=A0ABQ8TRE5_PERAM|nr:hypothetical protein ANN_00658 [Periplaneta americana]